MKFLDKIFSREANDYTVLKAEAAVGDHFKTWVQSDVGRYITGRAEQYEHVILKQLAQTNPKDTTQIIQLQAKAEIQGLLLQWIEEAIAQGEVAMFQLSEMESE